MKIWPWLVAAHFGEILAEGFYIIGSDEEGQKFWISHVEHDEFDDLGESEKRTVVGWYWNFFGEEYVRPWSTAGFFLLIKEAS